MSVVPTMWGQRSSVSWVVHKHTKIPTALRKEIYARWKREKLSLRGLGALYHVDKKVIQRIIERGKKKDFSVHDSTNVRFKKGG